MIGRGGMGSVWQAVHIGLDTPCALKFIEGELINVAEAHTRFEREAKVSAQLRSPHVVQIIDHGVWQGRPYIAMELLEGDDLGRKLALAGGRLPPAAVNMVVQQLCRALTKAHAAGIVHRDLKPDNIFLVNDDDRQLVKILDFGVAKQNAAAIENSNTKTGAMLGTPYYMSPEQAQGIRSVDARSDLWSVAVIAYQCLTGRLPFESEALGDLLVKIIVQPIPVPSQVAYVPPGFDRWFAKAADRNPDNRFQTAKELAQQLELALGLSQSPDRGSDPLINTAVIPGSGQYPAARPAPSYGTPATFAGVEPPAAVPKKGAPVALFAVLGVLLLVGLAGAGIAVKRVSFGSAPAVPSASAGVASSEPDPPPSPPPPNDENIPAPPPTGMGADPDPPEPPASASVVAKSAPPPTVQAPAPAPVKPQPSASAKKWDPGF
ncbi:MAG: protein kinase [Labilithrix sp.]|nr:protein kinase [Labilithrix sp.]MCW5817494.1 protein kinase [Labilithrix sp.]